MIVILLRILSIALALWLVRRIIAAFQAPKTSGNRKAEPKIESTMVKDPICGMYMDPRLAIRLENKGASVYFCSEECKKKYLVGPSGEGIGSAPLQP
jgi:YHS domain-containing protein